MNHSKIRILWRVWLLLALCLLLPLLLHADNCSGPGDCEETGGYIAGVTTVISLIGTGIGLWGNWLTGFVGATPQAPPVGGQPGTGGDGPKVPLSQAGLTGPVCQKCGKRMPGETTFCPWCGGKQIPMIPEPMPDPEPCPKCGVMTIPGTECPNSANHMVPCPRCGMLNDPGAICRHCLMPGVTPEPMPDPVPCPNCGTMMIPGTKCPFCSGPTGNPEPLPDPVFCQQCHQPIPSGNAFCPHCGGKQTGPELPTQTTCPKCTKPYPVSLVACPWCAANEAEYPGVTAGMPGVNPLGNLGNQLGIASPLGYVPAFGPADDGGSSGGSGATATCSVCSRPYVPGGADDGICPACMGEKPKAPEPASDKPAGTKTCPRCNQSYPAVDDSTPCPSCPQSQSKVRDVLCAQCGETYQSAEEEPIHLNCPKAKPASGWSATKVCSTCGNEYPVLDDSTPCPTCAAKNKLRDAVCTDCGATYQTAEDNPIHLNCPKAKQPKGWAALKKCPTCGNEYAAENDSTPCPHCPTHASGRLCEKCKLPLNSEGVCSYCGKNYGKDVVCDKCGKTYVSKDLMDPCPHCHGLGNKKEPKEEPTKKVPCSKCGDLHEVPFEFEGDFTCEVCKVVGDGGTPPAKTKPPVTPPRTQTPPATPPPPAGDPAAPASAAPPVPPVQPPAASAPPPPPRPTPVMPTGDLKTDIYSGNQAIDLLQQSGLAKVERDSSGKITSVTEAFPGAFSGASGKPVVIETGRVDGDASNPAWVTESTGKVTAVAFPTNPDGSLGDPVVVVDHGPGVQRPDVPDPAQVAAQQMMDAAAKAAQQAQQAVTDAAQAASNAAANVQQQYQDLKSKLDLIETARGGYAIYNKVQPAEAQEAIEYVSNLLKVDPARAKAILEMDMQGWNTLKAGVNLPGEIAGGIMDKLKG